MKMKQVMSHNIKEITGSLTLLLIKYISEEFALSRPNPYLCCQKEEEADRKGKLSVGTTVL